MLASETAVIAAAVLAGQGHLRIVLVVIAAAVGALTGDKTAYAIGHSGLRRLADRLMNSENARDPRALAKSFRGVVREQAREADAESVTLGRSTLGCCS